jgi:hypothetical protein
VCGFHVGETVRARDYALERAGEGSQSLVLGQAAVDDFAGVVDEVLESVGFGHLSPSLQGRRIED